MDNLLDPTRRTGELDGLLDPNRRTGEFDGAFGPTCPFSEIDDGCFAVRDLFVQGPKPQQLALQLARNFAMLGRSGQNLGLITALGGAMTTSTYVSRIVFDLISSRFKVRDMFSAYMTCMVGIEHLFEDNF
ncbi:hypothetical protein F2Q69_00021666 [Brassica cretica]|uniref:Uncharacterized protein n=1 Tax=Brassica cretica TaxID=69181 RepID=A0A8S9QN63_BRACR|nr:hypothetical protein F2Q69_00021666 [Brassica cretica]